MKRWGMCFLATGTIVVAIAGCGSSKRSAEGVTKAQYIARAGAICHALERKIVASTGNFEDKIRQGIPNARLANAQLRAIPVPPSGNVLREWLLWRERALADAKRSIAAKPFSAVRRAAAEEEFNATAKARALARGYGLPKACINV